MCSFFDSGAFQSSDVGSGVVRITEGGCSRRGGSWSRHVTTAVCGRPRQRAGRVLGTRRHDDQPAQDLRRHLRQRLTPRQTSRQARPTMSAAVGSCRVVSTEHDSTSVGRQCWLVFLGIWSIRLGVLKLWVFTAGRRFPQIFSGPSGETICHFPKHIRDTRMAQTCSVVIPTMSSAVIDGSYCVPAVRHSPPEGYFDS